MAVINRLTHCPFPRHAGKEWAAVLADDRPFVEWLVSIYGPHLDEEFYDHLIELLEESADG